MVSVEVGVGSRQFLYLFSAAFAAIRNGPKTGYVVSFFGAEAGLNIFPPTHPVFTLKDSPSR